MDNQLAHSALVVEVDYGKYLDLMNNNDTCRNGRCWGILRQDGPDRAAYNLEIWIELEIRVRNLT